MLLHKAQHGIDNQQRTHHGEIREFPEHRRQHHDQFEHPRRDSPKFPEEFNDGVTFCFGYFVVAVFLPAGVHLRLRESGIRVDMERRERVGNRRGGNIGGLGVCGLRGIHMTLLRRVHPRSRARVVTLAQKSGGSAVRG